MANYLEDSDLLYEIILSKGKGTLTKKAEKYFILIAEKTLLKFHNRYKNQDEELECLQQGLLQMFSNWSLFNEKKYTSALPYLTEIFKRGAADAYNMVRRKKSYHDSAPKMISIDSSNDGKGLHNI
jgi:hypothetical protein